MKRILSLTVLVAIAASVLFLACPSKGDIKIGAILPQSGDAAAWGERALQGIQMAVDEVNAAGGIRGSKVTTIAEDSKASPQDGVTAMRKLVTADKVTAVVGDLVSSVTLAIAPLANENKVVLISPTASATALTQAGDYVFRNWPSDVYEGTYIAGFLYDKLQKRNVAVLYINNDYGVGLRDAFAAKFQSLGGKVVVSEGYSEGATDFRAQIGKIKAAKPDAVYMISYYKDAALILRQSKEAGLAVQFIGASAVEDPKLLELAGKLAEGLIYPVGSGYDSTVQDPAVQKFRASFKKKFGTEPAYLQAQAYDAVKILAKAMADDGAGGAALQKAMAAIKDFPGAAGMTSFDANGDVVKPLLVKTVSNGQFVVYPSKQ